MSPARTTHALAACLLLAQTADAAERAKSAAEATVFIRLTGSIHVEVEEFGMKRVADRDRIEIGSGSGFVISPYGYVLTNDHVVSNSEFAITNGMKTAKVTLTVAKIDVCFPRETSGARLATPTCVEASVYASDPVLDLAVLFISAANLPYLALGDSDAVAAGQPVNALGYPFGRELEIGQAVTAPDLVPDVSINSGTISATRAGPAGERQYLQISSNVNPGNSGGPVVDRDGFVLGVVRMKLADATGIAFAIAVNQVKDFLDLRGLDHLMPSHRLRLGPFQTMEGKGVGLRLPEAATDSSRFRSRVAADATSSEIGLRIDRVQSSWNLKQIEQVLIGSQSFERFSTTSSESKLASRADDARLLTGRATGTALDSNLEIGIEYGILDLGSEKLVARYVGPAPAIALNASVLRESLIGIEGQKLIVGDVAPIETMQWSMMAASTDTSRVPVPAGWLIEPSAPSTCTGLPQATTAFAATAPQDFTISIRAAVWSRPDFSEEQAASACSPRRASLGPASYTSRGEWLGVSYVVEGAFSRVRSGQMIQLEVIGPDQRSAYLRALLAASMKTIRPDPSAK